MQAHVALTANGHAQGTMTEHLDTYLLATGTADVLLLNLTENLGHLVHVQLAGQHNHIGKLGIEAQGLDVRDVQLCGEVYLLSHPVAIGHHSYVAGNHSRDACLFGGINNFVHQGDILAVNDGINCKVALNAMFIAGLGNLAQIVDGKSSCRMGTHVQLLDAEVNTVGTSLNGRSERFARTNRSHYFVILNHITNFFYSNGKRP